MKEPNSRALEVADVIERSINSIAVTERYPDVRTKIRFNLNAAEIRCLAIIAAEAVMNDVKHLRVSVKRSGPKYLKATPRGHREMHSDDKVTQ